MSFRQFLPMAGLLGNFWTVLANAVGTEMISYERGPLDCDLTLTASSRVHVISLSVATTLSGPEQSYVKNSKLYINLCTCLKLSNLLLLKYAT